MKLATLRNGRRDGRLVVVSRDLTRCTDASFLVPTLQAAMDDWARMAPHLEALAEGLEHGSVPTERFHEHDALSPLPRAYQWADGSAYVNHVELVRKARGAEMPESFWTDPLIYQGGSDAFLAPRDPIELADEAWGIDMEGEVAVIVDDVPMGASLDEARDAIRLIMLSGAFEPRRGPRLAPAEPTARACSAQRTRKRPTPTRRSSVSTSRRSHRDTDRCAPRTGRAPPVGAGADPPPPAARGSAACGPVATDRAAS